MKAFQSPLTFFRGARGAQLRRQSLSFSTAAGASSTATLLTKNLPHVAISTNPYELQAHGKGESYHAVAPPDAVVVPKSVQEVIEIVELCGEHHIPIVPYGAGTSVEGHIAALQGGISMDMSKFDMIQIESEDGCLPDPVARVGAGVKRKRLNEELRHSGLHFVVDPGADATIGGMVACGASGTTTVKYGGMRENVLGLECVLADGTFVRCGTTALKNSAGYDLTSLLTGSEGTLGVITSVLVKLHPIPEHVVSSLCVFEDLFRAAEAVAALKLSGVPIARCELLDSTSVKAFNNFIHTKGDFLGARIMEEKPTLFMEFHGPSQNSVDEQVQLARAICTGDYGASDFRFTAGEEERKALWAARHNLYYASIWFRQGASGAIVTDACVALSKFAGLMSQTAKDVEELKVIGPCFGHAIDGNFHCILPVRDNDSEEYLARVHQVNDNLMRRTLEAGGTCTGEHGIGYGKTKYMARQYGEGAIHMMKLIKKALDPKNVMNPGKVLPG